MRPEESTGQILDGGAPRYLGGMSTTANFQIRRSQFLDRLTDSGGGPVFLVAGGEVPRNYPANVVPYRPDSNFLFFIESYHEDMNRF